VSAGSFPERGEASRLRSAGTSGSLSSE
jgi:hypothetical protein